MEIEKILAAAVNATPIFAVLPTGKVFACRSIFESYPTAGGPSDVSQRLFLVFAGDSSEVVRVPAGRLFEDREDALAFSLGLIADRIQEHRISIEALEVAAVANRNALEIAKLRKVVPPAADPDSAGFQTSAAPPGRDVTLRELRRAKAALVSDLLKMPWDSKTFPAGLFAPFKSDSGPALVHPGAFVYPPEFSGIVPPPAPPASEYVEGLEPDSADASDRLLDTPPPPDSPIILTRKEFDLAVSLSDGMAKLTPASAVPLAMEPLELPGELTEIIRGPIPEALAADEPSPEPAKPEPISADLAEHAKAVRDSEIPF